MWKDFKILSATYQARWGILFGILSALIHEILLEKHTLSILHYFLTCLILPVGVLVLLIMCIQHWLATQLPGFEDYALKSSLADWPIL